MRAAAVPGAEHYRELADKLREAARSCQFADRPSHDPHGLVSHIFDFLGELSLSGCCKDGFFMLAGLSKKEILRTPPDFCATAGSHYEIWARIVAPDGTGCSAIGDS